MAPRNGVYHALPASNTAGKASGGRASRVSSTVSMRALLRRDRRGSTVAPATSSAIGNDAGHSRSERNRSALLTTDTELKLIASAATIGDSIQPSHGYSAPAASGTPMPL